MAWTQTLTITGSVVALCIYSIIRDVKREMKDIKKELRAEIKSLRTDVKEDIREIKSDMRDFKIKKEPKEN